MTESAAAIQGRSREAGYEGLGRRALAILIDDLTWLVGIVWILSYVPSSVVDDHPGLFGLGIFVLLSLWFNYFAFCEWRWGRTIGKSTLGARVTTLDGGPISFGQASTRNLLRLVDFFVVGWVMIATDPRRQRLGDKAAKTVVRSRGAADKNYSAEPVPASSPRPAPHPQPPDPGGRGRLPAISWGPRTAVWGLIGGLLLAVVSPLLVLPFDTGGGGHDPLSSDGAVLATQALFELSLVAVAAGIASGWSFGRLGDAFGALGLRRARPSGFGWALLMLLVYYLAAAIFSVVFVSPKQKDIAGDLGVNDSSLLVAITAVTLIAVVAPFAEELFFRGFFFSGLRSRLSLWPAALISGIIFGLPHIPSGPLAAIPLSGLGFGLAWLYNRTGSLWPCVFAHVINNALALALVT
jgi:membrane protease YdiL (CAAX protease family)/uncharacterized RDD family membrane protein YckC